MEHGGSVQAAQGASVEHGGSVQAAEGASLEPVTRSADVVNGRATVAAREQCTAGVSQRALARQLD